MNMHHSILDYILAPEESRLGRTDYWNSVFPEKKNQAFFFIKIFKIAWIILFSICIAAGISML